MGKRTDMGNTVVQSETGSTGYRQEHRKSQQGRVARMVPETSPAAKSRRILDVMLKSLNTVLLLLLLLFSFRSQFQCYFLQEAFLDNPYYIRYCVSLFQPLQQTVWLINNRNLLLTVLEAGIPRSG